MSVNSTTDLKELVEELRGFAGITRKKSIGRFASRIENQNPENIISGFGEDCAVVDLGDEYGLLAAEGIMENLMRKDPFWAGYCSVLANVNDVLAMGGKALALVDVLAYKNEEVLREVARGINLALERFSVPLVGGHLHPDSSYDSIEVAIFGIVGKGAIIRSDRARSKDSIIAVYDLKGSLKEGFLLHWDTTLNKTNVAVKKRMNAIWELAREKLANSGKDISNPGLVGTVGMLLESSGKGGIIDLDSIRVPRGLSLKRWLKAYHGFGFVFTCPKENIAEIKKILKKVGVEVDEIGVVNDSSTLNLRFRDEQKMIFDLKKDGVTGLYSKP